MIARTTLTAVTISLCFAGAEPALGRIWTVGPADDYRKVLPKLEPGDELVLREGVHDGAAAFRVAGTAERLIVIRGSDSAQGRPILTWNGSSANLWQVSGEHLIIRGLEFRARRAYGIRIGEALQITIDDCVFRDCGGGDLSANSAPVDGLRVTRCQFLGSRRTPVYIGNHDGKLPIAGFVFEGNVIDGTQVNGEGTIGYGIQLKLNVTGGVIRDNFIRNTKGPGIMVYGATNATPAAANRVEGNVVVGSRNNSGSVVGGGPAVVRNNVVVSCRAGGIAVINYGGRNLLDGIIVEQNTAVANRSFDFSVAESAGRVAMERNRAISRPEALGFRGPPQIGEGGNISETASPPLIEMADQFQSLLPTPATLEQALQAVTSGRLGPDEFHRLFENLRTPDGRGTAPE